MRRPHDSKQVAGILSGRWGEGEAEPGDPAGDLFGVAPSRGGGHLLATTAPARRREEYLDFTYSPVKTPPRRVPRRLLSDIIEPRCEEIFHEVRRRMEETGLIDSVSAGVVLTGGANLMEGMVECAEEVLGMPVRMGFPVGVTGLTQLVQGPQYASGVGLLRFAARQLEEGAGEEEFYEEIDDQPEQDQGGAKLSGLMGWLRGAFSGSTGCATGEPKMAT